jgi:hypothetical protein
LKLLIFVSLFGGLGIALAGPDPSWMKGIAIMLLGVFYGVMSATDESLGGVYKAQKQEFEKLHERLDKVVRQLELHEFLRNDAEERRNNSEERIVRLINENSAMVQEVLELSRS